MPMIVIDGIIMMHHFMRISNCANIENKIEQKVVHHSFTQPILVTLLYEEYIILTALWSNLKLLVVS